MKLVINLIGIFGTIGQFTGVYLMSLKNRSAWIVWLFSGIIMLVASILDRSYWSICLFSGFTILNILGIYRWYIKK